MSSPSSLQDSVDRTEDGRPIFKTEHYDKLELPGAIRILNVFPGHNEDSEVHCELIPGTILNSKKRMEYDPPLVFEPYDALSWCWGLQSDESWISIRKGGTRYAKAVRSDLVSALRALRHHEHDRRLWIDAVCIDEDNVTERNRQVEMMADIYGNADCVRIWLGNPTESSRIAIRFIKKEVLQLQHFDELCESEKATEKWKSLLELMQRPWFSRRWVVQEVALARKAIIHCGSAKISWNKFAVAVELFVEVETATHRLSEVMKKDPKYYHIPMWFEYVSALGASLLVDATGKLFRDYDHGPKLSEARTKPSSKKKSSLSSDEVDIESEDDEVVSPRERAKQYGDDELANMVVPKGQPLLNLEYLVCSLSVFNTLKPHDTIYALLGIAKDTSPSAVNQESRVSDHTQRALEMFMEKKKYPVSYEASYVDVCKEFIQFCIDRALRVDSSRALDVICRPWAAEISSLTKSADEMSMPSWIPQLSKAAYGMDNKPGVDGMKMGRKNADALVGMPTLTQRNYNAAETKGLDTKTFRFRKRFQKPETASSNRTQESDSNGSGANHGKDGIKSERPRVDRDITGQEQAASSTSERNEQHDKSPVERQDTTHSEEISKPGARLITVPHAQLNHFSMYVKGFVLDRIKDVQPSSQNGSIPSEWAEFAGWRSMQGNPPDHFWRTLVADRGRDGKNPPVYYSRACKESFSKGSFHSGTVDTNGLIKDERNSVVAQFCRRVQAAIWNRALVRTEGGKLGLVAKNVQAGDLVCILYGCSVPVVLRRDGPKESRVMETEMEWELRYLANRVGGHYKNHLERREKFRAKREIDNERYVEWELKKREAWRADRQWAEVWKNRRQALMLIHAFNNWVIDEKSQGKRSKGEIEVLQDMVNVALTDQSDPNPRTKQQKKLWAEFETGGRHVRWQEWRASREEWQKDTLWRNTWNAENTQFLCIDSFRAWLRDKGKFCGTEEHVEDKQDWESDIEWRRSYKPTKQEASEQDEFKAWMVKTGKRDQKPHEVQEKELNQFSDWLKDWQVQHSDANPPDALKAWGVEQEERAKRKHDVDKSKAEAAKQQQSQPFLERWRKGWAPPVVNWRELRLGLAYYRKWKQVVIRRRKDSLDELAKDWYSLEKQKKRHEDRRRGYEKRKMQEVDAVKQQEGRTKEALGVLNHNEGRRNSSKDAKRRRLSQADALQTASNTTIDENGVSIVNAYEYDVQKDTGKVAAEISNDRSPKESNGAPVDTYIQDQTPNPTDRDHDPGTSEPISSSAAAEKIGRDSIEKTQSSQSRQESIEMAANSSENRMLNGEPDPKLPRHQTSLPVQEIQLELTQHPILSKDDLKRRIERKRKHLPEQWTESQENIELEPGSWRKNMPRRMGRDPNKYDYDCGRKDKKRKQRQRLDKEEIQAYNESIAAKFRAKLGDDGQWWYRMFGECYIHGMMDGEAMAHQNNEGISTNVFEIR
ncbi:MAG: hypothetical protein M1820_008048 [Bogoriella megaspora]|nr:MAG: hypothetical protein M1820_008048 [Bogoriella megaspora]